MNTRVTWTEYRPLLLLILVILAISAVPVYAGGTVAESKSILLQRSGVMLTDKTNPPLACPQPKTILECAACALEMYDAEIRRRTTGYVTYKCMDVSQWKVTFNKTPVAIPEPPVVEPPPPTTALQVYACADAGADGRILERHTEPAVRWPNCQSASFQNPSKSLVVAVNPGSWPFYWRLASTVTSGRIWTQKGTEGKWSPPQDIDWGAPITASVTISWQAPTQNTDGSSLTNLAGYRIVYGTSATALDRAIDVPNPALTSYIVGDLTPATYYFAVRAYTSSGAESTNSSIASKALP